MKVTVTERKFTLPIAGIEHTLSEQEARELWASLNEHFGPKPATPTDWTKYPFRHPLEGGTVTYPPIWHPDSPLKVTCDAIDPTKLPPGVEVVTR